MCSAFVRARLARYFIDDEGSENAREAAVVTSGHMCAWEELHDTCVSAKQPRDLRVCYLAGPEPMNDFKVLCDLGVDWLHYAGQLGVVTFFRTCKPFKRDRGFSCNPSGSCRPAIS